MSNPLWHIISCFGIFWNGRQLIACLFYLFQRPEVKVNIQSVEADIKKYLLCIHSIQNKCEYNEHIALTIFYIGIESTHIVAKNFDTIEIWPIDKACHTVFLLYDFCTKSDIPCV